MLDKPEIARLIASVAHGDARAFDRLYDRLAPQLFAVALRIVGDRAQAEDVLQDAFTRVWTRAATYDPVSGDALAWLYAIVRHGAIDHIRRAPPARRVQEQYDGWFENLADPRDEEGALMSAGSLRRCLGALDETTRACVVEAYCGGLSGRELAERHAKPENTIKSLLRRGLTALKACLDDRP